MLLSNDTLDISSGFQAQTPVIEGYSALCKKTNVRVLNNSHDGMRWIARDCTLRTYYINVTSITLCNHSPLELHSMNMKIRNICIHSTSSPQTLFPFAASLCRASSLEVGLTAFRESKVLPHDDTHHHMHRNSELHHLDHQDSLNQSTRTAAVTALSLSLPSVPFPSHRAPHFQSTACTPASTS
jgi:hypothetical protein